MKKVLFVINTMGQAGAERAMLELMKLMNLPDYEISLLVLLNRGELFSEVPGFVKVLNPNPDSGSVLAGAKPALAKLVIGKSFRNASFFRNIPWLFRNFQEQKKAGRVQPDKLLWKIVSDGTAVLKETYDAAVAYLEGGAAYYVADHVRAKRKMAFIHIEYGKSGFTPVLDHGCYDKMDRIYAVSLGVKESFLQMYPALAGKTKIFNNVINTDLIKKRAEEGAGFTDGFRGFRIVTIGRLHYQKGYDITIPVVMKLRERGYDVRWYVLGDGPQRKEVEQWIQEAGAEKDFILLGAVRNPYPYLKQCDLYVHATRYEGKSIAIEEAQALGKAVIASDCPGNREQIRNGENGLLVPLNQEKITEAVITLMEEEGQRRRFEQANAQIDFSRKEQIAEFMQFINSAGGMGRGE